MKSLRRLTAYATVIAAIALLPAGSSTAASDSNAAVTAISKPAVVKGNTWYLRTSLTTGFGEIVFRYGRTGTFPLMGDWDGDGTKTPGIVDGNKWYLRNSNTTGFADVEFVYGVKGDHPIVGDWDGDGLDTPGVVRFRGGCGPFDCVLIPAEWHLRNSNTTGVADLSFSGLADHTSSPVVGDWDADGDDNPGARGSFIKRNEWYLDVGLDGSTEIRFQYGSATHIPITGDWNGDGVDSAGVVSGNTWLLRNALTTGFADFSFQYGSAGDKFLVWE